MEVTEGGLTIDVPEQDDSPADVDVFYNPEMALNRDLTIATLRAYRSSREPRAETYLDAMAASGIRGVRAAADGWAVTCCDADPAAAERCRANLARNGLEADVVCRDVNALLYESETVFDVVDLDPFGTPIPYADAAFATARNLVCVTATDTAPLCGAHFASGVRKYGAVPRNTEYHAEMGLRVLVSALARTAARYDVGVDPILSHATRHYARTYLELTHRATDADRAVDALGYVHHCQDCLYREHASGLVADPPDEGCPNCSSNRLVSAGPIWLEPVRDRAFVEAVRAEIPDPADEPTSPTFGEMTAIDRLLERLAGELDQPTHYDQHRLYKQWGEPAIGMDAFLDRVREAGFGASRTHYGGTTFKTTASVADLAALFDGDAS